MFLLSFTNLGLFLFKLLIGQGFFTKCHCDLDLWPSDLKINRGHLLVMGNVPTKFHKPRLIPSQVIDRTRITGRTDHPITGCSPLFKWGHNKNDDFVNVIQIQPNYQLQAFNFQESSTPRFHRLFLIFNAHVTPRKDMDLLVTCNLVWSSSQILTIYDQRNKITYIIT